MASIAAFAWASSRCSSLPKASEARVETVERRNWPTSSCRSSSARSSTVGSRGASSANPLTRADLLAVDLDERRTLVVSRPLALGRVLGRHAEVRCRADLVRDGRDPLQQLLDPRTGRYRLAALEVDQLAGEPVAD